MRPVRDVHFFRKMFSCNNSILRCWCNFNIQENNSYKGKKTLRGLTCGATRLGAIQAIAEKTVPPTECALMPPMPRHKLFWEVSTQNRCRVGFSFPEGTQVLGAIHPCAHALLTLPNSENETFANFLQRFETPINALSNFFRKQKSVRKENQ